jgi:hypothetical protein
MWDLILPAAGVVLGLSLALFLALYLFCTLKAEIRTAQRSAGQAPPSGLDEWTRRLEAVEARSQAAAIAPERAETSSVPLRPAMNLSRRSQALRLARRGEPPEQIASRLGLATGEVRLLLKIHGMLVEQALHGPARAITGIARSTLPRM